MSIWFLKITDKDKGLNTAREKGWCRDVGTSHVWASQQKPWRPEDGTAPRGRQHIQQTSLQDEGERGSQDEGKLREYAASRPALKGPSRKALLQTEGKGHQDEE